MIISGVNMTGGYQIIPPLPAAPPAPPVSPIVTSGLLINLDAGDLNSYPGTGSTWTNLVNSTPYTITAGTFDSTNGGSIVFNGTSTFVEIGTPLSNGTNFTKEAWVYADVITSSRNIISSAKNVFWNNGSTLSGGVNDSYSLVTNANFPAGVWRHIALTFNDITNTMRLYINGVQVAQNTNVTLSYVSDIERIGAHFFNGNPVSFWDGKIAQVRIYNTDLTAGQILQNYDAGKSRYSLVLELDAGNLSSYSGSGSTWINLVDTANSFTLYNNPTWNAEGYFDFNPASNVYAAITHRSKLKPTNELTLEQWLNADNWSAGTPSAYFTSLSCTQGGGYATYIWENTFVPYVRVTNISDYLKPTGNITGFTGWHHFVTTFNGRYANLYIDGALANTADAGATTTIGYDPDNDICIGTEAGTLSTPQGFYWDGKIATTSIFNTALSANTIAARWNDTKSRYGL